MYFLRRDETKFLYIHTHTQKNGAFKIFKKNVLFIVTYPETCEKKPRIQEDDDKVFRVFHKNYKKSLKVLF